MGHLIYKSPMHAKGFGILGKCCASYNSSSKVGLVSAVLHASGLPVRTGVEGECRRTTRSCRGPPCANRGRRTHPAMGAITGLASLCEQGSKLDTWMHSGPLSGLPVRTGVEESPVSVSPNIHRSPCANRGRRVSPPRTGPRTSVSLCEQGSKADQDVLLLICRGLPVRTVIERGHPCQAPERQRYPCANRGRRD